MNVSCSPFEKQVVELVEGLLPAASAASLRSHAAHCTDCSRLLRRETGLVHLLRSQPASPVIDVVPPALPAGRLVRISALRLGAGVAAAAAAMLLAVAYAAGWTDVTAPSPDAPVAASERVAPATQRVRVSTIIDGIGRVPLPDEGLLALTAGVEAVAMRRPTEAR